MLSTDTLDVTRIRGLASGLALGRINPSDAQAIAAILFNYADEREAQRLAKTRRALDLATKHSAEVLRLWRSGSLIHHIMDELKLSRVTVFRILSEAGELVRR